MSFIQVLILYDIIEKFLIFRESLGHEVSWFSMPVNHCRSLALYRTQVSYKWNYTKGIFLRVFLFLISLRFGSVTFSYIILNGTSH